MATRKNGLPDVSFETIDGNLKSGNGLSTQEQTSCLLFDISTQKDLFKKGYGLTNADKINEGEVIALLNESDMEEYGIIPYTEPKEGQTVDDTNFMYGIPHYHISEYYGVEDVLLYKKMVLVVVSCISCLQTVQKTGMQ